MAWRRLYVCGLGVGTRHGIGCAEGILTAGVAVACAAAGVDSRYVCFCHGYVASVPLRLACRHGGDVLSHFYGFQTGSNRGIRAGTCRMDADADCCYVLMFLPDRMSEWAERRFVGMRWFGKLLLLCLLLQLIIEFSAAYVAPFIYAGF